ncbi:MAG: hypothetical protein A2729_00820 [Candidatus Buchananbacteria bacterium RIFCSPHIGHO2_01_FULL_39_14]|uniref:Uncharacterized protein n=1 Tax=Candidatus Buchananbacteria bacterium RIFCSPHIGHO2_01_FULL_39_14 TaxID=1797532 RepID=A0A1G1XUJ9_9BACT|nr:MAG: hypothetical protein A2729_00820 [Candidatus Buchananbacteria bacterium RIFCSPHIGHO2_01_FULL_39_14]OGY49575.1 MAG: hypothetical protein A3D39_02075 [Candidatus Buchananbacteria bacterium RIFCSPHIGHO2_02_FULL_39_17]
MNYFLISPILKATIVDLILDLLYFPVWWYTKGFIKISLYFLNNIQKRQESLSFFIWLKNIFVPMYGQSDFEGRLISFFVRLAQVFFRLIGLLFWLIVDLMIFLLYLLLPLIMAYQIYFQVFYA